MSTVTEMKLINLIRKIISEKDFKKYPSYFSDEQIKKMEKRYIEYILEKINFIGQLNGGLSCDFKLIEEGLMAGVEVRMVPLSGEEIIRGDYLLFLCNGYEDLWYLIECASLEEIADKILEESNYIPFITDLIPIIDGQIKHYQISYKYNDQEYIFDTKAILNENYENEIQEIKNLKLVWLD